MSSSTEGSGTWSVEFASSAVKALHRLPEKIAAAVVEFATGDLARNPRRCSGELHNELARYRSARRGDYRLLILLDDQARTVLVVDVDHRAHIYRSR